jgi:hypothetical protein
MEKLTDGAGTVWIPLKVLDRYIPDKDHKLTRRVRCRYANKATPHLVKSFSYAFNAY